MKKILFLFLILTAGLNAQTTIPGGSVSGTWTLAGSPYNVQGSIFIPGGSTLTIDPGVTVNFTGTYKLLVTGRLLAIGTASDSITFIATNPTTGWRGIRFDNTLSTSDSSEIQYAKLLYGKANGAAPDDNGGAIYFNNFSKVTVAHCLISKCSAQSWGGGIYCKSSNPAIYENHISYCSTVIQQGGGIYCESCGPVIHKNVIDHCASDVGGGISCVIGNAVISENVIVYNTSLSGGGICSNGSTPVINGNTISHNTATQQGGAIHFSGSLSSIYAIITNNTIEYNTVSNYYGGGIYYNGANSNTVISYNIIRNNTATGDGGGIYSYGHGDPSFGYQVANNLISNNSTAANGGGIYFEGLNNFLVNNTITNNSAAKGGGIYCSASSSPSATNCILYGNTSAAGGAQVYMYDESSDPDFNYCDIEGGSAAMDANGNFYTGTYTNNIDLLPVFVSPAAGSGSSFGAAANWRLQSTSPCINAGTPASAYSTDLDGNFRLFGTAVDMGVYELQGNVGIAAYDLSNEFVIYPNPASSSFTIRTKTGDELLMIDLYDFTGKHLMHKDAAASESVDITSLDNGTYLLMIKSSLGTISRKLVVMH